MRIYAGAAALWDWIGCNAAEVQAIAALLGLGVAYLIWRVYARQAEIMQDQAEIMDTQKQLSATQLALQGAQTRTDELLALAELGPVLVPAWARDGTYPLPAFAGRVILKNAGRGCAFNIRVCSWRLDHDLAKVRDDYLEPRTQFVAPGQEVRLRANVSPLGKWTSESGVLVLHYQDFLGKPWHTTWNLSPGTGEYEKLGCPVIWNPGQWHNKPQARRYCAHCPAPQAPPPPIEGDDHP